jgi:anti-sigma B factor antagonist
MSNRPDIGIGGGMVADDHLSVERRSDGDVVVLVLQGELDLASSPLLERVFEETEAVKPAAIVLDLRDLRFMDSTGLKVLLHTRNRCREDGFDLSLRRGPHQVQRLFELTGTLGAFTFED